MRMWRQKGAHVWRLKGGLVLDNHVNDFSWQFSADRTEEAAEFLMPVMLHVANANRPVDRPRNRNRLRFGTVRITFGDELGWELHIPIEQTWESMTPWCHRPLIDHCHASLRGAEYCALKPVTGVRRTSFRQWNQRGETPRLRGPVSGAAPLMFCTGPVWGDRRLCR